MSAHIGHPRPACCCLHFYTASTFFTTVQYVMSRIDTLRSVKAGLTPNNVVYIHVPVLYSRTASQASFEKESVSAPSMFLGSYFMFSVKQDFILTWCRGCGAATLRKDP